MSTNYDDTIHYCVAEKRFREVATGIKHDGGKQKKKTHVFFSPTGRFIIVITTRAHLYVNAMLLY